MRQWKEAEEALRRAERAGSSREHRSRGGASNGKPYETPQGSSAVEHEMDRMREKLKPDGNEILDSILGNTTQGRKTAKQSTQTSVDVPCSIRSGKNAQSCSLVTKKVVPRYTSLAAQK